MRLCPHHHASLASIRSSLGSLSGVSVVLLEEENSAESLNEDDSEWDYDERPLTELRQPRGGGGFSAGRPARASQPASHLANHHCFVHACLPHHPCSQDLKMMSPIHGVCGKIVWDNTQNKTIPFANVVHDDMPVSHDKYQAYYVLTQKVYDFVLGYMSRNEELET